MKLLANENIPLASVKHLISIGIDVLWIGYDHSGISDKEVMEIAINQNRAIVTFDSDYGELIFKFGYRPLAGVIYLRFDEYSAIYPGQLIQKIIESDEFDFKLKLTVVDEGRIRQRKY